MASAGTVSSSAIAMPVSPTMAARRAGMPVANSCAVAPDRAVVATTAPPKTRLWMPVCWAASDGYSDSSTPSTDQAAITPIAENQKSARISCGTAGLAIRIRPATRWPCGSRSTRTPAATARHTTVMAT
ncbi:Uncharacterised protein [Mycobacteroides abscessus subsp. abscessus]|nr:Uncharacterised protein [Mycobacteroides abscessus subsp. abscessus]